MGGFFENAPVHSALVAGSLSALVSAVVGFFVVVRVQAFAGHALGDVTTLGGSGAFLLGIDPLWGYLGVAAVVAGAMELVGVERRRSRDVATGAVLGAALGVAALLLFLDATSGTSGGATVTVLFGSLFAVGPNVVFDMVVLGAVGLLGVAVLYRPLLLASLHPDLARTSGVRVRAVSLAFLVLVGVTVSLASMAVGTILSPALLVGPPAAAFRLSRRPPVVVALGAGLGLLSVWVGIALSYTSYNWPPIHRGWPVSFFVVAAVLVVYLLAGFLRRLGIGGAR